jgi:acyl transferase domain-containing protein/NADPH:quinone reductase-like Zn-dependent oxidoreductase
MSGRFPGARDVAGLWRLVAAGECAITEIPAERFDWRDIYGSPAEDPTRSNGKWIAAIDAPGEFDADFFEISPREAQLMDPRQRLLLQEAWKALEDAAMGPARLRTQRVGLFVGVEPGEYQSIEGGGMLTANHEAVLASRLAFILDLHGPAMAINTACSSSLVAAHQACLSLRAGDCDVAVVAGANLVLLPGTFVAMSQAGMLSPTGKCRAFDVGADGLVPGEAVVAVVLKRLSRALADGDCIQAVIRGSGINYDGRSNGITAPNGAAQAELVREVLERAGVSPHEIGYVVTHGTGTRLGDPVEIKALQEAFGALRDAREPCAITSVKPNVGHTFASAGLVNLVTLVQALEHAAIPPSIDCVEDSAYVDWSTCPVRVNKALRPWQANAAGRRMGAVSAFGMSGTNAHMVLESAPRAPSAPDSSAAYLLVLSAKTPVALRFRCQELAAALDDPANRERGLAPVARTLLEGRHHFDHRVALVARDRDEAVGLLRIAADGGTVPGLWTGAAARNAQSFLARSTPWVEASLAGQEACEVLLSRAAAAYCAGQLPQWRQLCDESPDYTSLPAYPFERQIHWKKVGGQLPQVTVAPVTPAAQLAPIVATACTDTAAVTSRPCIKLEPVAEAIPHDQARPSAIQIAPEEPVVSASDKPEPDHVPTDRLNELIAELRESLATALYLDVRRVEIERPFMEMGLDSIVGVEWVRSINRRYGTRMPATRIYDHPTVTAMAKYLARELAASRESPAPSASESTSSPGLAASSAKRASAVSADTIAGRTAVRTAAVSTDFLGVVIDSVHEVAELDWRAWQVEAPQAGEVSIAVRASGVNFPDLLCVRGLYPTQPEYPFVPGFEVSGVVRAVGAGVRGWRVGDEVVALTGLTLGGHATVVNVPATGVIRKPVHLTFEQAASLPVMFTTAWRAFQVAELRAGESVLIHTTTGGCGLAALQLARLRGANCLGSSSRETKREILRRLGLQAVFDYREAFDEQVRLHTGGRGVDVVLNMLSGGAIQKGLNCLAPYGRYLEIAVHALRTSGALDLSNLVQNQSFHSIDLRRCNARGEDQWQEPFSQLQELLARREVVPVVTRVYPRAQLREALEYVGRGEHVGKVVLSAEATRMQDHTEEVIESLLDQARRARTGTGPWKTRGAAVRRPQHDEAIAIVGMSGALPQADELAQFWQNLAEGRDCVREVHPSRWSIEKLYDPEGRAAGKSFSKWLGQFDNADRFDPLFFNISPAEAEWIDPQQRLFLQQCWSCIEDAGIDPQELSGSRCGVYVGCAPGDYGYEVSDNAPTAQGLMGGSSAILSARISYFLNLKGPCLAIDTACSSSLVAIAEACDALVLGRADAALAGGVCVLSGPALHIMASQAGMLSRRGRCYAFDRRADGFVPGEGAGVLLLKRLSDAQRDGDQIHAVIRGWGVNQDGKTNGMTAPSASSQMSLEQDVYARFGIDPGTIGLVEAHGTGTELGDPIEVEALTGAFRGYTQREGFCALGSVKSNIGHLLTAAGVAGVLKVVLAMQKRQLPPTIHFERLNEHITLEASPFYVNTELRDWTSQAPRRAAVSSFGFSGTNAHVVLEEAPADAEPNQVSRLGYLVALSARTPEQLREQLERLLKCVRDDEHLDGDRLSCTLMTGRRHFEYRWASVCESRGQLLQQLRGSLDGRADPPGVYRGEVDFEAPARNASEEGREALRRCAGGADEPAEHRLQLERLAHCFVRGESLEWRKLWGEARPRMRLPGYPFARERYWRHGRNPAPVSTDASLASTPPAGADPSALIAFAVGHLTAVLAEQLRIPVARLKAEAGFEAFGIDSMVAVRLVGMLEKSLGPLPKSLFFEHPTIGEVAKHLVARHRDALEKLRGEQIVAPRAASGHGGEPARVAAAEATGDRGAAKSVASREPIAIIGISGRYAGANDLHELWHNLSEGRDCITEIPTSRWDHDRYFDPRKGAPGRSYTRWGGFIDGIDQFDARYFGISPREARGMDPQERLFLQCAQHAIEDAGYTRERFSQPDVAGNVGVFVGVMNHEYQLYAAQEQARGNNVTVSGSAATIANRVSFFGNFQGPSMAVDSMCSASLTAIHLACQSLQQGECAMAIAGGVNLAVHPNKYLGLSQAQAGSSVGRCHSFGAGGDGYVPGEGVGAVLLRPLSAALAQGDEIHGIIRASAINHTGRTPTGYFVPNPVALAQVTETALSQARIPARAVSYIEAHGTGTALGDPIEIAGLTRAFGAQTDDRQFCAIGSVKSNIGHAESAAGIAGLSKILLQMRHGMLVPSLHSRSLNPNIDFARTAFRVQQELAPWPRPRIELDGTLRELPRIAGLSSFGAGGSNAHLIIEEPPSSRALESAAHPEPVLIVLSARTHPALDERVRRLLAAVRAGTNDLSRIAYTLQTGREEFAHRMAVVAGSVAQLIAGLEAHLCGSKAEAGIFHGVALADDEDALADESQSPAIRAALVRRDLAALAEAWCRGVRLDWRRLYGDATPRRTSLPGYPFETTRHWMFEAQAPVVHAANMEAPATATATATATPPADVSASSKPRAVSLSSLDDVGGEIALPVSTPAVSLPMVRSAIAQGMRASPGHDYSAAPRADAGSSLSEARIERILGETLADILMMDAQALDWSTPFFELGLDSVTAVEWLRAANLRLGTSLQATVIYDYPSIRDFARFVAGTLDGALLQPVADARGVAPPGLATPANAAAALADTSAVVKPRAVSLPPPGDTRGEIVLTAAPVAMPVVVPLAPLEPMPSRQNGNDHTFSGKDVQRILSETLAEVLMMDAGSVDSSTPFFELGLDSVTAVEWLRNANRRLGSMLQATSIYDYPCIRDFARFVTGTLNGARPAGEQIGPTPAAASAPQQPGPTDVRRSLLEQVYQGSISAAEARDRIDGARTAPHLQ